MATLYRVEQDGARVQQWELNSAPVVVGRSPVATIQVEDEGVSRRHLMILREGDRFVVKDLNSRNGTWLDEERVSAAALQDRHRIRAGSTVFLFEQLPVRRSGPHGTVLVRGRG